MKLILENRDVNKLKEKLFYVGILSIITIVLWMGLNIYVSFSKTTIDPKMTELVKPLNPILDSKALVDYESSRIPAPERFQITTIESRGNKSESTLKVIDPFSSTVSSPSAISTQE